ncbi:Two-component sensor histidine kinase, contains HisKA and HATPase domains [Ferrithrix thermotolerans DSM 19514]|uniref:histidine kinase n=1 Tax=Ferrithrix thermotolerans DSM 19514 TaxID=1121881 RepID=A0A1M4U462_9ACTN|nr:histidine kinase N-terminal domain-containing protein [Ferrithrix thermotolerans]SHE51434.1 Two-component sensor histidine kinase, contains HisKA and HATPase domains [Ferrithrix thermotolerans DSM 19514]
MQSFPDELITKLPEEAKSYFKDLVRRWGFLADLCFSDLLIYIPTDNNATSFMVAAQVRPATSQTVHPRDLVGIDYDAESVYVVESALRSGGMTFAEWVDPNSNHMVVSNCIPLKANSKVFGVLARDYMLNPLRIHGELESTYVKIFDRFAKMILAGDYPYKVDDSASIPRVGDGVVLLDEELKVRFLSPNALSALHRLGCSSPSLGKSLADQGIELDGPLRSAESLSPVLEEIEGQQEAAVTFFCMPLINSQRADGFLLLLQDVTNIRRSERLLISKDATIREIHHRVKNNLQTISSLLRLQSRRVDSVQARDALAEAERRIRSIAVVHEVLSREIGEQVSTEEIVGAIIRLAQESVPPGVELKIDIEVTDFEIEAQLATPLAVVLQELIQNSIEHGSKDREELKVTVGLQRFDGTLRLTVGDDGVGFPPEFSIESSTSLGLLIVRDLVRSQLRGELRLSSDDKGSMVSIEIPTDTSDEA